MLNRYEFTKIANKTLPYTWQSQSALDELQDFLQKNWEQRSAFYDDGEVNSKQQFLDFMGSQEIRTKRYIGTIVFKGEQLNIYPRVFGTDAEDHNTEQLTQKYLLNNLVKWLEYCNKFAYPFINISSDFVDGNDLKEFFITLYIGYVLAAIKRGRYYQYFDDNIDCNIVKGRLNFSDYVFKKIPTGQADKFQCAFSTFEFDNIVNRIIKYTCKQLYNMTSKNNQKKLRTIYLRLDAISDVACTPNDCNNIRLSRMHKNYEIILSMSKMFLLNKVSDYSMDINESFCFLFPTDLLFEGFVGGFLKDTLENLGGKATLQESKMHLVDKIVYKGMTSGSAFTMRHDILAEVKGKLFILDTKYKALSRFDSNPNFAESINKEVVQGDLYQVLEYARKRNVDDVYLLYPMYRFEEKEDAFPTAISESPSKNISIHFIRLPFVFEEDDSNTKAQLVAIIKQIFCL